MSVRRDNRCCNEKIILRRPARVHARFSQLACSRAAHAALTPGAYIRAGEAPGTFTLDESRVALVRCGSQPRQSPLAGGADMDIITVTV